MTPVLNEVTGSPPYRCPNCGSYDVRPPAITAPYCWCRTCDHTGFPDAFTTHEPQSPIANRKSQIGGSNASNPQQ